MPPTDDGNKAAADVLLSGVQAAVRLLALQRARDHEAGLSTSGFVSGYRGSPLGGLDSELVSAKARGLLEDVTFDPGLNEDLAATACLGTQQIAQFEPTREGVFAMWYGKGPGVDRSCDALKHGNMAGVAPKGGVLVVFGDDHAGKSSTVAHQSEHALAACSIPVLYPSSVEEVLRFGQLGWELSRYSGLWAALKLVNETAETASTVNLDRVRVEVSAPQMPAPPEGVHYRGAYAPLRDDVLVTRFKLPRAKAFARANRLDTLELDAPQPSVCIVTSGKAFTDVTHALTLLDLTPGRARAAGVRLYKVGMIWPLDEEGLRAAVGDCQEVLVVEEKRAFLEPQVAAALINLPRPPRLVGKFDEEGRDLLPADEPLDPAHLAMAIAARLELASRLQAGARRARDRLAQQMASRAAAGAELAARLPYFCSGCPHNLSTRIPDGSMALSGIGCHGMAMWMNRSSLPPVQMGAEGANWIGAAPFAKVRHVFQNLGDGTFSHSGLLAVRAAVNAKVNITYKILLNDAVAMTGGQPVEGGLSEGDVARQVLAAGVRRCVVVSEDPARLADARLPKGVPVRPRAELERVQQELRGVPGVTVLIYSQVCATEKRRRRKRQDAPAPEARVFINAEVCENCGDCTAKSNCISIVPKATELGRKREIDQSSCNQDFSCLGGFCPAFVTLPGARLRRRDLKDGSLPTGDLPAPQQRVRADEFAALIAGIGGTGVVTISVVLAMAARLEGKPAATYNMTGLAQKGGAVHSHLRIGHGPFPRSARLTAGEADLLLACDQVAAVSKDALAAVSQRTAAVVNVRVSPTAAFQRDADFMLDEAGLAAAVERAVGRTGRIDAAGLAQTLFADALASNMLMVGYAYQAGLIPLDSASIEQAIRLNGAAVEMNLAAFQIGRLAQYDPDRLRRVDGPRPPAEPHGLEEVVAHRRALLVAYQDKRYASAYEAFVRRVQGLESRRDPGQAAISTVVARCLAKLMAYKDEYEVARLHRAEGFRSELKAVFEGNPRLRYHLAPPLFVAKGPARAPRKSVFGSWMDGIFALLARLRFLRGTPFDPFGWLADRRLERRLIAEYREQVMLALQYLRPETRADVLELVAYPEQIRGFGHVKARQLQAALRRRDASWTRLREHGSRSESALLKQPVSGDATPS